jgi:hypothetical protein
MHLLFYKNLTKDACVLQQSALRDLSGDTL